jgi:hypothetical protein
VKARSTLLVLCLAAAGPALAGNMATCLLDKLPGVKNAPAHAAALNLCSQQHPDKFLEVRRGSGRGMQLPSLRELLRAQWTHGSRG